MAAVILSRMTGIEMIAAERNRQITEEGWTKEHDSETHENDEALPRAAHCYLSNVVFRGTIFDVGDEAGYRAGVPYLSDWPKDWKWSPKSPTEDLIKAGALIAAELDRRAAREMES